MSSITQARLAPITQRYMSMSFRRQDWTDKSASPYLGGRFPTIVGPDRSDKGVCHPTFRGSRSRSTKFLSLHIVARETCNPCKRGIANQRPQVDFNCLSNNSLARRNYEASDGGIDVITDCSIGCRNASFRYENYTHSSRLNESSSLNEYSSEVDQKICTMLDFNEALTISKIRPHRRRGSLMRISSHERNRDRENENYSRYKFSRRPFFMTLAVLGLFRKPTERELEEEREQLSDEQKVKKMKPVEIKIAKGVLSMCDQEFGRANDLFHEALHMAQDEEDVERENLILNLIAANYFESGDMENAEKLFIDIMKRMINQDVAPTAPPILELSLKLASIYSKNPATHEKALKGFKFVINSLLYNLEDIVNKLEELDIETLSDQKRDELALLGWSYDWFAKHLLNMNDYAGAADMLQRSVQISLLVLGPLHDQTLILLNDIGTTLAMNNSPEQGKIFIRKAVEGAIANQSKELASFYVNLGLVNLKLRKLDEAKRYCEYSMELAKKNRDHYNTQEVIELSQTCLDEVQRLLDTEGQQQ